MKKFESRTIVRSKLKAHVGKRGSVLTRSYHPELKPDETKIQWLIDTPYGDWGGRSEVVKTRNLVEIRKVVTVTWEDVK